MSQKIHFASVTEICKKSLSERQTFQTFAPFMIDKLLAVRTLIICCINPKGQILSYQEPGGWKCSFRDQKFTTYFFCSILFLYLKISSFLQFFNSSPITSTSVFHKSHLLCLSNSHSFRCSLSKWVPFSKNTKVFSSSSAEAFYLCWME